MKNKFLRNELASILIYMGLIISVVGIIFFLDIKYDYSKLGTEKATRFGISFMTMNNPFFSVISDSIRTSVEANGDIVIVRDPELSIERQDRQIRDMIDEGIDVLFVTPVDYKAIIPTIQLAKKKGIIVISVDSEIYDESLADCVVVSNNYLAGKQCAEYLMNYKESAQILILEHPEAKSSNDRVKGFKDAIERNDNFKIVEIKNTEGQLENAMPITGNVISNGTVFDTVFAINDTSAMGAMAALKDSGRLQYVDVLGVDGAPEAKAMIKEGIMLTTSAQYPTKIGDYAINQAYKIIRNEAFEKKILVDVKLITVDNVDQFGTSNWQ